MKQEGFNICDFQLPIADFKNQVRKPIFTNWQLSIGS